MFILHVLFLPEVYFYFATKSNPYIKWLMIVFWRLINQSYLNASNNINKIIILIMIKQSISKSVHEGFMHILLFLLQFWIQRKKIHDEKSNTMHWTYSQFIYFIQSEKKEKNRCPFLLNMQPIIAIKSNCH